MLDAAQEVQLCNQYDEQEEIIQIKEIPKEEWEELCQRDPRKLSPQEVFLRDRPFLVAAQNGDADAWTAIWKYYENAIVKKIREFFWDPDDQYDIAQFIYIRAFEKLYTYNTDKRFFPWIHTVIRNYSLNLLKHQRVVKMIHAGTMTEHDIYEVKDEVGIEPCMEDRKNISARDEVIKAEEAKNIRKCVSKLSEKHKEIITMKHFEDLSYKEIADKLNIPIGTVMSRLFNARNELSSIWNEIIENKK